MDENFKDAFSTMSSQSVSWIVVLVAWMMVVGFCFCKETYLCLVSSGVTVDFVTYTMLEG